MIYRTRKSREEVARMVQAMARAGKVASDEYGFAQTLHRETGHSFLSQVYASFLARSFGEPDELGNVWKPIQKRTLAYRSPSSPNPWRDSLSLPKASRLRPTLTREQDKLWRRIFVSQKNSKTAKRNIELAAAQSELSRRIAVSNNKSRAAAVAWIKLKEAGAKTLIGLAEASGYKRINVNTGELLAAYHPDGHPAQKVISGPGFLVIKVNLEQVKTFYQRPLLPPNQSVWLKKAAEEGRKAMAQRFVSLL